ncbi:MAG TPA: hypothetical protein VMW06_01960 [Desulfobacterales bacterium]|nr:hypothetical protein [Desulfobacterales bacterium]
MNAFDFGTAKRRRGAFSLYWGSNAFALDRSGKIIDKVSMFIYLNWKNIDAT